MTTFFLTLAVILVGALWTWAQWYAARKETPDRAMRVAMTAVVLYFGLCAVNLALGASGVLRNFDRLPPPMAFYFAGLITVSMVLAFSRFGDRFVRHVPLAFLIGFHGFRILAELMLDAGYRAGLTPPQLTFHGYNFDIVVALTGLALLFYLRRNENLKLAFAWNLFGVASLVDIAFIALTSMPAPFRLFHSEPSNIWVTGNPYILLPGILVLFAIAGHVVVFRKIAALRNAERRPLAEHLA